MDAANLLGEMGSGIDSAVFSASGLLGLSDEVLGSAMPKGLDAASILGEMTAGIDSAVRGAADLQGPKETLMRVASPFDLGMLSPVRERAANVNATAAWAEGSQKYREEVIGFGDRWTRLARSMSENSRASAALYLKGQERFGTCCMKLGQHGWFLDPEMPMSLLWYLADTIEESPEATDELIMQWFQERLDAIEEELIKVCPGRTRLLRAAFKAHREDDYNNSVPVFLKEADGMWHDLFGMNVFVAKARMSIAKRIEGHQPYGLGCSSLVPLLQSAIPLWMNERERRNWMKKHRTDTFPGLNRHEVMHGISLDYGTEINSLKAISFLNWRLLVELFAEVTP